jgi:hypothetical protein
MKPCYQETTLSHGQVKNIPFGQFKKQPNKILETNKIAYLFNLQSPKAAVQFENNLVIQEDLQAQKSM